MILGNEQLKDKCYGCYACANACPTRCIELTEDIEGFRYPKIDIKACTNCDMCENACPIGKSAGTLHPGVLDVPDAYACYILDNTVRKRSASGGIAFAISEYVISKGGVVFGCVGNTLEHVYHTSAETIENMYLMCGSKYVQSDIGETYIEAWKFLQSDRLVLYTGTPCQIAGLYAFLKTPYDNLITCDLICHGVPSQNVLKAYIKGIEDRTSKKVLDCRRTKMNRFKFPQYIIQFNDESYEFADLENSYYRNGFDGYSQNLFIRKSCYYCQYAAIPRVSDFSLGDWFYRDVMERLDPENKLGVSVITVNSDRGKSIIHEITESIYKEPISAKTAKNAQHISSPPKLNKNRENFFASFHSEGFEKAALKYIRLRPPLSIYAKRFMKSYLGFPFRLVKKKLRQISLKTGTSI